MVSLQTSHLLDSLNERRNRQARLPYPCWWWLVREAELDPARTALLRAVQAPGNAGQRDLDRAQQCTAGGPKSAFAPARARAHMRRRHARHLQPDKSHIHDAD